MSLEGERGGRLRWLWLAAGVGLLARLLLIVTSSGSNDALIWELLARAIGAVGLGEAYRTLPIMNHPPLGGLWAWAALWLAGGLGLPFAPVFKLLPLASDLLVAVLVGRIAAHSEAGRGTQSAREAGAWAVMVFALNPVSILITGYHCNTDSVLAGLALWAAWRLERRRDGLGAGLLLGLALHVKLIPLVLLLPLLAACRSTRERLRFLGGLSLVGLLFLPWSLLQPGFVARVLGYRPRTEAWGLLAALELLGPSADGAQLALVSAGAVLVLGSSALLAVWVARQRVRPLQAGALAAALFLVLASGFGLQYLVFPLPLLLAVDRGAALRFSLPAGAYLLLAYGYAWTGSWPLASRFDGPLPWALAPLGLLVWAALVIFVATGLVRGAGRDAGGAESPGARPDPGPRPGSGPPDPDRLRSRTPSAAQD